MSHNPYNIPVSRSSIQSSSSNNHTNSSKPKTNTNPVPTSNIDDKRYDTKGYTYLSKIKSQKFETPYDRKIQSSKQSQEQVLNKVNSLKPQSVLKSSTYEKRKYPSSIFQRSSNQKLNQPSKIEDYDYTKSVYQLSSNNSRASKVLQKQERSSIRINEDVKHIQKLPNQFEEKKNIKKQSIFEVDLITSENAVSDMNSSKQVTQTRGIVPNSKEESLSMGVMLDNQESVEKQIKCRQEVKLTNKLSQKENQWYKNQYKVAELEKKHNQLQMKNKFQKQRLQSVIKMNKLKGELLKKQEQLQLKRQTQTAIKNQNRTLSLKNKRLPTKENANKKESQSEIYAKENEKYEQIEKKMNDKMRDMQLRMQYEVDLLRQTVTQFQKLKQDEKKTFQNRRKLMQEEVGRKKATYDYNMNKLNHQNAKLNKEKQEKHIKLTRIQHQNVKFREKNQELEQNLLKQLQKRDKIEQQRLYLKQKITLLTSNESKHRQELRKWEQYEVRVKEKSEQSQQTIGSLKQENQNLKSNYEKFLSMVKGYSSNSNLGIHNKRLSDHEQLQRIIQFQKTKYEILEKGIKRLIEKFPSINEPFEKTLQNFDGIISQKINQERKSNKKLHKEVQELQKYKSMFQERQEEMKKLKNSLTQKQLDLEDKEQSFQVQKQNNERLMKEKQEIKKENQKKLSEFKEKQTQLCQVISQKVFKKKQIPRNFLEIFQILSEFKVQSNPFFRTSQILKGVEDEKKEWIISEVVKDIQPKLNVSETKMIFKSDKCNKDASKILRDEYLHDFIILCRTKKGFIFGAYVEKVSFQSNQNNPVSIFSLNSLIKYPKMIRTDRKFRPVFVNEQNVIVFGLSEMKITRNMQFMHSQSSQGYYGAMNQKEMFGESISIKLELQEMQIHEVDFK